MGVPGRFWIVTTGMGDGVLCLEGFLSGVASSTRCGGGGGGDRALGCGGGGGREISFLMGFVGPLGVDGAFTSDACLLVSDCFIDSIVFSLLFSLFMVPGLSNSLPSSSSFKTGNKFK